MTFRLCFSAIAFISSILALWPKICTGTIAFVFSVIFSSILEGSILNVSFSTSTNTGTAPTAEIVSAVAKKVNGVVITSSPAPIPKDFNAITKASVPFPTDIACLTPMYSANSFSNSVTFFPIM